MNKNSITYPRKSILSQLKRLGSDAHRVSWYGDIILHDSLCGGVPSINVVFARCSSLLPSNTLTLRSVALPISLLPLVPIGSIWVNGRNVGDDHQMTQLTLRGLAGAGTQNSMVPAGGFVEIENTSARCLPFATFPFHTDHTSSWLTVAWTPDNVAVLIPCAELIRFYYGVSGSTLSRLFSGPLAMNQLWTSAKLNPTNHTANINLAPGLNGAAASTVARIAFNPTARAAAQLIVRSTMAAHVNRVKIYPKSFLPFVGNTDLTVFGRWIHNSSSNIFLAERLITCTHPFPFSRLFYRLDASLLDSKQAPRTSEQSRSDIKTSNITEVDRVVDNSFSSRSKSKRAIISFNSTLEPFPDLIEKKIIRTKQPSSPFTGRRGRTDGLTPEPLGTGAESWQSDIRGIEPISSISQTEENKIEHPHFLFLRAVGLAEKYGLPIRLVRFGRSHPVPQTSPEYDESGVVIVSTREVTLENSDSQNLYVSRVQSLRFPDKSFFFFSQELTEEPDLIVIGVAKLELKPINELRWIVKRLNEFYALRSAFSLVAPWVGQVSSEEFLRKRGVENKILSCLKSL